MATFHYGSAGSTVKIPGRQFLYIPGFPTAINSIFRLLSLSACVSLWSRVVLTGRQGKNAGYPGRRSGAGKPVCFAQISTLSGLVFSMAASQLAAKVSAMHSCAGSGSMDPAT